MNLKCTTVIFDLFGTLVPVFSATAHEVAVAQMASALAIPLAEFTPLWNDETYPLRSNGTFKSIEENLAYVCHALNMPIEERQIALAAQIRYEFTRVALESKHDALETLLKLKQHGYKTGLISNCSPDVPALWQSTPFAQFIDLPLFSCEVKLKKPDPRIYQLALARLGVAPQECLYVGDGSDHELTGAKESGMHPVLLDTLVDDAYDKYRADVSMWQGKNISNLGHILDLLKKE